MLLFFVIAQSCSATLEGFQGVVATRLDGAISETATTITVDDTQGFPSTGVLIVDQEKMTYLSTTATTFVGVTRGEFGTTGQAHPDNRIVFDTASGVVNEAVSFNIAQTITNSGPIQALITLPGFIGTVIAKLVVWDYSFFYGDLFGIEMAQFQIYGQVLSFGLILFMIALLSGFAQGIFGRLF